MSEFTEKLKCPKCKNPRKPQVSNIVRVVDIPSWVCPLCSFVLVSTIAKCVLDNSYKYAIGTLYEDAVLKSLEEAVF